MQGPRKSYELRNLLVPCRLSTETISLSACILMSTHLYFKQNHEPKNLDPTELPGGSTVLCGGGKGTPTQPAPIVYLVILNFVLFVLSMHVIFARKFVPFPWYFTHMLAKQTSLMPDIQCVKMLNKHELPTMVQCKTLSENKNRHLQ